MGNIITTNDGANHILFDYDDFTDLIREQMGTEAERWLSDYIADMYGDAETIDAIVDVYEKELEQLYYQVADWKSLYEHPSGSGESTQILSERNDSAGSVSHTDVKKAV